MFHDTHIHLEMLLDNLKMSNFRGEMEFLENSLWQKSLENNSLSNQNQTNLCQYFDKINQIKITKEQKSKIVELFQNHEFAIHSTVNFANFGLVYQLFSDFPKIKFLFGSHPEIVNTDFDLEKYLENQQNFLNFWTQNQNQNELNLGKIGSQNNSVNSLNLEKNLENTQHNSLILDSNWSQKIIGIGEIGLDYFYTKDQNLIKIQQK